MTELLLLYFAIGVACTLYAFFDDWFEKTQYYTTSKLIHPDLYLIVCIFITLFLYPLIFALALLIYLRGKSRD